MTVAAWLWPSEGGGGSGVRGGSGPYLRVRLAPFELLWGKRRKKNEGSVEAA